MIHQWCVVPERQDAARWVTTSLALGEREWYGKEGDSVEGGPGQGQKSLRSLLGSGTVGRPRGPLVFEARRDVGRGVDAGPVCCQATKSRKTEFSKGEIISSFSGRFSNEGSERVGPSGRGPIGQSVTFEG